MSRRRKSKDSYLGLEDDTDKVAPEAEEEFEEIEEWEYGEAETEQVSLRDRVSIKDILKLVGLFIVFAAIFVFFRFWDFFAGLLAFGQVELGESRLLYLTLLLFPLVAVVFIVWLVDVSKTLFIPPKKTADD